MLRKRRRNRYKFTEKKHSVKGIVALLIAAITEIVYLVFIFNAFKSDGQLSMYYGSAGVFMLGIAILSLVLAFQSMFEEDSFRTFPRIALLISTLCVFSWSGTFIIGIML